MLSKLALLFEKSCENIELQLSAELPVYVDSFAEASIESKAKHFSCKGCLKFSLKWQNYL